MTSAKWKVRLSLVDGDTMPRSKSRLWDVHAVQPKAKRSEAAKIMVLAEQGVVIR